MAESRYLLLINLRCEPSQNKILVAKIQEAMAAALVAARVELPAAEVDMDNPEPWKPAEKAASVSMAWSFHAEPGREAELLSAVQRTADETKAWGLLSLELKEDLLHHALSRSSPVEWAPLSNDRIFTPRMKQS